MSARSTSSTGGDTSDLDRQTSPAGDQGAGAAFEAAPEIEADTDTDPDDFVPEKNGNDEPGDGGAAFDSPSASPMFTWLSTAFVRPKKAPDPGNPPELPIARTNAEKRAMMIRLDAKERKVVVAGSVVAAAFTLAFTVPYMVSKIRVVDPSLKPNKHHQCGFPAVYVKAGGTCNVVYPPSHYVFPLVVWGIFAIGLYVTARVGRRVPAAFVALMTGFAFGSPIALIPFGVGGAWLLLRAWRVQKWGSPTAKGPITDTDGNKLLGAGALRNSESVGARSSSSRGSRSGSPGARRTAGTPSPSASAGVSRSRQSGRASRQAKKNPAPTGPAPNKRYTPKAPTRRPTPVKADKPDKAR